MGVFARLLRRSKAAEEASTAEAQIGTPMAESEAEGADGAKGSKETTESGPKTAAGEATAEESASEEPASEEPGAGDDVEIPQQQTAEKAADNEAGEGARN